MKKRKPFAVGAGVGAAVITTIGATQAVAQSSATMGVNITVQALVSVSQRPMNVTSLPIFGSGTAAVSAPTAANGLGSIGGPAMGGGSVTLTVGAFAFTRNAPISIAFGSAEATMACRQGTATGTNSVTTAITVGITANGVDFALNGTSTATGQTACSTAALGYCGVFVLPTLTFPTGVGVGACSSGTLSIPLTYATT